MRPVLTTLPPSCAVVMKSRNLYFPEPSGPLEAWNGTDLPLQICATHFLFLFVSSTLSRAKVKNEWSYTSTPPLSLRDADRDNINFPLLHFNISCLIVSHVTHFPSSYPSSHKIPCHKNTEQPLYGPPAYISSSLDNFLYIPHHFP